MIDRDCFKEDLKPLNLFKLIKYKINFNKNNPDFFRPCGLHLFVGKQGGGKTLTAVKTAEKILEKYPKCKLITNLYLTNYPIITFSDFIKNNKDRYLELKKNLGDKADQVFYNIYLTENRVFEFVNDDDFKRYKNGDQGVLFLIDEIQLYWNSLQSKNINMDVINVVSQQRKNRMVLIATSQKFGRLAKALREQFEEVILCKNLLGFIQYNQHIDQKTMEGDDTTGLNLKGKVKEKHFFIHSPEDYKKYDTYYIIEKGKFISGEEQKKEIYSDDEIIIKEKEGGSKNEHRKSKSNN